MAVQVSDLMYALKAFHPERMGGNAQTIQTFRMLEQNIQALKPQCLYIGKASQLPSFPPVGGVLFLIAKDELPPMYETLESLCTIICVEAKTDVWELFHAVQEFFDKEIYLASFLRRLLQVERGSASIQKILDIGYEVLGNPLLLVDMSLCFIAHAGGNTVSDEPLWEWTISKGYVTKEYVDYILGGELDAKERFIWEKGLLRHDQLVYRLLSDGAPIGYIKVLASNRPITPLDQEVIAAIGNCLVHHMAEEKTTMLTASPLIDSFLTSLLNQKIYDKNAIDERISRFHLKLYDNITLIAVKPGKTFTANSDLMHLFRRKLQNFLGRDTIVYYNEHFVAIYDTRDPEPFTSSEWESFKSILTYYDCRAAISLVKNNLYSLPEQYEQAVSALSTAHRLRLPEDLICYSDILLQHVLLEFANHHDLNTLIHPAIRILQELDDERRELFLETIRIYIAHNMDIAPAAKAMFLHYNTMKYRLQKITELTDIVFDDADTIFHIQLSFRVLDILGKLNPSQYLGDTQDKNV